MYLFEFGVDRFILLLKTSSFCETTKTAFVEICSYKELYISNNEKKPVFYYLCIAHE